MSRLPRFVWICFVWILTIALSLATACGPITNGLSPSPSSSTPSSIASTSLSAPIATDVATAETIALTPNPLNVHVTLDEANAQTGVYPIELTGQTANGTTFALLLQEIMVSEDVDGTLLPAYGTPVTLTPVSTIDGIPFSYGFLAAVQLAPHGLFMLEPAMLMMTIPAEYAPGELVGFAWDGSGENFHLYPANIISGGGQTIVLFDIFHIGADGVGVAPATPQEVADQHAHLPQGQTAQDEDLLASLQPFSGDEDLLVPILEGVLREQHDTVIRPAIDRVFEIEGNCNYVDVAAQQFITWHTRVVGAGAEYRFQDEIARDTSVLQNSLTKCMQNVCSLCMGTPPGNKRSVDSFLIHAFYAERIATIALKFDDAHRWSDLANACAEHAGRPLPSPIMCDTCCVEDCEPEALPVCPVP